MAPGHSLRRRWATPRRCSAGSCSHTAISSPRCGRRFETTGCPRLARRRGRTRPPDVRGNAREADPQDSHPLAHPRTSSSPTGRTRTPARSPHGNIPQPSSSPRPGSSTASPANPRRLRPSRHRHQPRHPPRIRRRASPSPRPPPTMTSSPPTIPTGSSTHACPTARSTRPTAFDWALAWARRWIPWSGVFVVDTTATRRSTNPSSPFSSSSSGTNTSAAGPRRSVRTTSTPPRRATGDSTRNNRRTRGRRRRRARGA